MIEIGGAQREEAMDVSETVTELRDYRIADGSLDEFVEEWQALLAPLRRKLGFRIEGAWVVREQSRFVWLLAYPGDWKAFEAADARYHSSPERRGFEPNPARLIEGQTLSRLVEVDVNGNAVG
jgi:hypothetical protein